jgi:hypothetical protein
VKSCKSNLTFCVVCVFGLQVDDRLTSGAFTIDSSTLTLKGILMNTRHFCVPLLSSIHLSKFHISELL